MQLHLALRDRLAQPAFDRATQTDVLVHALVEYADDPAPVALGIVERQVGTAHQIGRVARLARLGHDQPHRRAALYRIAEHLERARARLQDARAL